MGVPLGCNPRGSAPSGEDKDGVELIDTTAAGLEKAVAERKGSVVLIDFWATFCGPCVARFPHIVELQERYREQGLAVVGVCCDEPEDRGRAVSFLNRQHAKFPNYIRAGVTAEENYHYHRLFGLAGGIPHMALFGRDGKRVWTGVTSDAVLTRLIEDELAKK